MLTGYQTATVGSFLINDLKEFVDTGLELFLFQVIGALVDVKVSVTCVAEGLDDQSAIFAGLVIPFSAAYSATFLSIMTLL